MADSLSLLYKILILKHTWGQIITQKPNFYTSTLIIPFSEKWTHTFCFACSEHCLPGAVWEVENPGHWLFWPCDAGEAQRNRTALCHEDPQQAEGQSRSEVRWVTVGWRENAGSCSRIMRHIASLSFDMIFIQTRSCFNPPSCTFPQSSYFWTDRWGKKKSFTGWHASLFDINYWLDAAADWTDPIHPNITGVL